MPTADRHPTAAGHGCTPAGDLTPWPADRHWCYCGDELRLTRAGATVNDWAYETLDGQRYRDDRPPAMRADPAAWWTDLRRRTAAGDMRAAKLYSTLTAREKLGFSTWIHIHHPKTRITAPTDRACPFCCGSPMWASPDGWSCRITRRLFAYHA